VAQTIKVRLAEIDAPDKGQPFAGRSMSSLCYRQQAEIHPKTKTVTTGLWLASTALASMPMRQWCETG
jgi:endonuclease YncB( thermonuclease family)